MKELKRKASLHRRNQRRQLQVPVFRALFESAVNREVAALREVLADGLAAIELWAEAFYPAHEERLRSDFEPEVRAFGSDITVMALEEVDSDAPILLDLFAAQYATALAARWVSSSRKQVHAITRDEDEESVVDVLEGRLEKWAERRHVWAAERESSQAGSAFAKVAYIAAGITQLIWRTSGGACPICAELDGTVVGVSEPFVRQGQSVGPDGDGQTPVRPSMNIGHPPLHGLDGRGGVCQCLIAAA